MPFTLVVLLACVAVMWLWGHLAVKRRFETLKKSIADVYRSAFIASTTTDNQPQLVALCVDLMRKTHCALPFEALTRQEQRMVLHAHAIEALPKWMSRYTAVWLSPQHRKLIGQLRNIHASRPIRPVQHFGAIKRQQQLRSAAKG